MISRACLINRIADLRQLGLGWGIVLGVVALDVAEATWEVGLGCGRVGWRYQSGADNVWRLERVGDVVKHGMMKIELRGGKGEPNLVPGRVSVGGRKRGPMYGELAVKQSDGRSGRERTAHGSLEMREEPHPAQ